MFSKTAILALLSSTLIAAAPQSPSVVPFPFPGNGSAPVHVHPAPDECVTSYSTSVTEIYTTIPIIESKTIWVNSTTVISGVATKTSLHTDTTVITTSTPTCLTTSYPVQIWVTKVIETYAPVLVTESCTETSTYTVPTSSTKITGYPSVTSCTEYTTSCATSTATIPYTTCLPCSVTPTPPARR
jgi:hypothetical protein